MSLLPGTRVGAYEILAAIGAGGMGEVYKARDTRLKRNVAVKALPETFASDPERLARFQREAEVLASLNHPNIAHIHGLEEAGGALVMEFVEGEDLAQKIARGPIPISDALPIARQIAEALEAAHEQGIIHRDLKPANIKVRDDGAVKVLDFGLAKAMTGDAPGADLSQLPTITQDGTRDGMILGTPAYMSPEQARGKPVDKRTDIWAFGCVLYEMLTGRAAFGGDTISDTIAKILERQPDWAALPAATPPSIRRLLSRCFVKDPKHRLRDVGDARAELGDSVSLRSTFPGIVEPVPAEASPAGRRLLPWLVAAVATLAVIVLVALHFRQAPPVAVAQPVARLTLPVTTAAPLATGVPIVLSPDGKQLVYRTDGNPARLYIRPLDGFEARPLAGAEGGYNPFFSPDGQRVGFVTEDGKLKWVPIAGGAPQTICDLPVAGWFDGSEWQPDDTIYFSSKTIWRVAASGGTPQAVTTLDEKSEIAHRWPQILPGGKVVLFTVQRMLMNRFHIALESLETHQRSDLMQQRIYARYVSSGHLIYAEAPGYNARESSGSLMASAFDLKTLKVTGSALPIAENIVVSGDGSAQFALSTTGTLVYAVAGARGPRTLVWVDRQGRPTPLPAPTRGYNYPRLSPDEHRLAMSIVEGQQTDVWTYDLRRDIPARVTSDGTSDFAMWKPPDDKSLVFGSRKVGPVLNLYMQSADGTGDAERLAPSENGQFPSSLSNNGDVLLFNERSLTGYAWHTSALNGKRISQPVITGPSQWYVGARISPDGHWVAYVSDEEGRFEIYVKSYASGQSKWKISAEGGKEVVWARDGRELYWRNGDKMMAAGFDDKKSVPPGKPRVIFEHAGYVPGLQAMAQYDVARDGRFVMVQEGSPPPPPAYLNVVLNWVEELKRLLPTK